MRRRVFFAIDAVAGLFATGLRGGMARKGTQATPEAIVATTDPAVPLYEADDEADFARWDLPGAAGGAGSWAVEGAMLVADGSDIGTFVFAPFAVPHDDYAVEAEAQVLRFHRGPGIVKSDFLLVAWHRHRFFGGVGDGCRDKHPVLHVDVNLCGYLAARDFEPGQGWHTYRLEVRGDVARLVVDGALALEAHTDRAPDISKGVGLLAAHAEVGVRRFAVYPLLSPSQP